MIEKDLFSHHRLRNSFSCALNGVKLLLEGEKNFKIHLIVTICVCVAGFLFDISQQEWVDVLFAIGSVLAAEAFNTAVEKLSDFVCSEENGQIGRIKDIAAGAVLMVTIVAVAVGLIIFIPKFLSLVM